MTNEQINAIYRIIRIADLFGISDFNFKTIDGKLIENQAVTFIAEVKVTCTKPNCAITDNDDNIAFDIASSREDEGSSFQVLATIDKSWTDTVGNNVSPRLGSGYPNTGYTRYSWSWYLYSTLLTCASIKLAVAYY